MHGITDNFVERAAMIKHDSRHLIQVLIYQGYHLVDIQILDQGGEVG